MYVFQVKNSAGIIVPRSFYSIESQKDWINEMMDLQESRIKWEFGLAICMLSMPATSINNRHPYYSLIPGVKKCPIL
jgi:hypothetical protein